MKSFYNTTDSDEPLLSGSGAVSRECSDDRLAAWREMVDQWKKEPDKWENSFFHFFENNVKAEPNLDKSFQKKLNISVDE